MGELIVGPWRGSDGPPGVPATLTDWQGRRVPKDGTNLIGSYLSSATQTALMLGGGVFTVERVRECSLSELATIPGIGPKRLAELEAWLAKGTPHRFDGAVRGGGR